jgi:hypothetical protein
MADQIVPKCESRTNRKWERIALRLVARIAPNWLDRLPEGSIFDQSIPTDPRKGKQTFRIQRVPESDQEAYGMAYDYQDGKIERYSNLYGIEDKTLKDARPRNPRKKKVEQL